MFSKVLVANRGEIAVRINQTLRTMGIVPIAVYSEPDAGAPHVNTAEQSVALSGNTAEETYLSIPKIVQAARDCGAGAIHPGYGFLSENPEFARACREAQITFIGPHCGKHGGAGGQAACQGHCPGCWGAGGPGFSRVPPGGRCG